MKLNEILTAARAEQDWITDLRRTLHRHPELMYDEIRTSQLVKDTLNELGIPYQDGLAETGVVGTLGTGDSPCVALRADMDALPIHEEAEIDFRSEIDGKMHACGHDCHTSMLLGAAKLLKQREGSLNGTVKLIFQPAEEGGAGGKRMSDEGALDNPTVQEIFGLHVWSHLPTGTIGSRAGTFLAASGEVDIIVRGKGGHAAMPHNCIDPVATGAKIITELQTIVAREVDPLDSGVISITKFHAGEAYNVIPVEAHLGGTIRALTLERFAMLKQRLREIATHVALANQCEAEIAFAETPYPPTVNDARIWDAVQEFSADLLGEENISHEPPVMGGEDFAFYTERIPGCFVGLGINNPEIGSVWGVHHPKFKADEDALPIGAAMHTCFALTTLDRLS